MANEHLQMSQLFLDQLFDGQSLLATSELQRCVDGLTLHSAIGINFFSAGGHGFHSGHCSRLSDACVGCRSDLASRTVGRRNDQVHDAARLHNQSDKRFRRDFRFAISR